MNLLDPGDTPNANIQFLLVLACIMKAVDTHADLLRQSASNVGNDYRLGADEAPPAIVSMFLGEQLDDVVKQLVETGEATHCKESNHLETGVSSLPDFLIDPTARNRTSPFAYTGDEFEFRMIVSPVGSYFGVSMEKIKSAIEGYVPSNNRSQTKKTDKNTLILDAYNANPTSMRSSLETFISMNAEHKCVILGEMFELGEASEEEHLSILNLMRNSSIPSINLVGKWPHVDWLSANYYATSEELKSFLANHPIEHSTILIKGSRGVKLEVVVDVL